MPVEGDCAGREPLGARRSTSTSPEWAFRRDEDTEERAAARSAGWPTSVFDAGRATGPTPATAGLPPVRAAARPRSLVLTEDDYFDFLIGATRDKDSFRPPSVGHSPTAR